MDTNEIWGALPDVPWDRLSRIHGNCHPSMIGLITGWWAGLPGDHDVLDGAPAFSSRRNADAVLCDGSEPIAVLEVEGSGYARKARTIGRYLCPTGRNTKLDGIRLGILVLYPVSVTRKVGETDLLSGRVTAVEQCLARAKVITEKVSGTEIFVVAVDKRYEPSVSSVRTISENNYHRCTVFRAQATRLVGGREMSRPIMLWPRPPT